MDVYVGNINWNVTEKQIRLLFEPYGEVEKVNLKRWPPGHDHEGKSRGFAFVRFSNDSNAEEAIKNMNGYEYFDRTLKVNWAQRR